MNAVWLLIAMCVFGQCDVLYPEPNGMASFDVVLQCAAGGAWIEVVK